MNLEQAQRRINEKIAELSGCPFCGDVPTITAHVHEAIGQSTGHYAVRSGCCPPTQSGQTELFFTPPGEPANYDLWGSMACRLVDQWNHRAKA